MKKKKLPHKKIDNLSSNNKNLSVFQIIAFIIISILFFSFLSSFSDSRWSIKGVYINYFLFFIIFGFFIYLSYMFFKGMQLSTKQEKYLFVTLILLFVLLYYSGFYYLLGNEGDNIKFILRGKALVEGKGYRALELLGTPKDSGTLPGVPLIYAFLYLIFGLNVIAIKITTVLFSLAAIIIAYYFFKGYIKNNCLLLLFILLFGTNIYFLAFSSKEMTENYYIFFSLLALFLLDKYKQKKNNLNIFLFLAAFFVVYSYLTRAVAILFIFIPSLYFFIVKKNFKKGLLIGLTILVFFLPWQIYNMTSEQKGAVQSRESIMLEKDFFLLKMRQIPFNLKNIPIILSLDITDHNSQTTWKINKNSFFAYIILLILLIGFIYHFIKKKTIMDFCFLSVIFVIIVGAPNNEYVLARYLCVLIPFGLFYIIQGLSLINDIAKNKLSIPSHYLNTIGILLFFFILKSNLWGIGYQIFLSKKVRQHPPAYARFVNDATKWAKLNTLKDKIFAVRKPSTFYLFSERQVVDYKGPYGRVAYSPEKEKVILAFYTEKNVNYIVLDCFTAESYRLLLPILNNNIYSYKIVPNIINKQFYGYRITKLNSQTRNDKFTVVHITPDPGTIILKYNK